MNPREIKTNLERALHGPITFAEWIYLEGGVDEYSRGDLTWRDFVDLAAQELRKIRKFRENDLRERAGELEEEPREDRADRALPPPVPVDLGDRTVARSMALGALNNLRSGGSAPPRANIASTMLPRGGVDGTVPQWVWVIAAELWISAEEIAKAFRDAQRTRMADSAQPRTQARALHVARFVWEVEAAYGERPSWPELCRLWNDSCKRWNDAESIGASMARRFDHWRDFRTYFLRGEKATLPRYKATDEQITEQVREATIRGEAVAFDDWVSQVRAATVQRDAGRGRGSNGSNVAAIEVRTGSDAPGHPAP